MKKLATVCSLVVLLIGVMAFNAAAVPITGAISFEGGYTVTGGDLATATSFASFSGTKSTGAATGSFAPILGGTAINMAPFAFNPLFNPTNLWNVNLGGVNYAFDMTSVTFLAQDSLAISLRGAGLAKIDGYDDTVGTWILTANSIGGTFSFSGSSGIPVPEPSTLILIGAGLLGLVGIRRKVTK
jgi:hypothetical protein